MAFRGRYSRRTALKYTWIGGQYTKGRPPSSTGVYPQENSSRLYISRNNASSINRTGGIKKGKTGVGGNFWVVHYNYSDSCSLGGMVHFTPNSNLNSVATPHALSAQFAVKASFNDTDFPIVIPSSAAELAVIGANSISEMVPTKPEADLSSFIGELREGLPHAIGIRDFGKERCRRALNAGDEYLNVEFGWMPFVRDLRKFADTYRKSNDILRKYHENSGKKIRRRFDLPTKFTVDTFDTGYKTPVPILPYGIYGAQAAGKSTQTIEKKTRQWVVASFIYNAPATFETYESRKSDLKKLYGVGLTPSMVWNMAPWSWAADWVLNGSSIVTNLQAFQTDGLAMPYCYVMETKSEKHTHELRGNGLMYRSYPGHNPYFSQSFETVSKYRTVGSPYGFGVNWDGFSPRQLAILAALGISRY